MALFEWVWRRPLSVRFVEWTTTAFAVLLISFMLYVSYNDILRFNIFKSMFQGETTVESAPSESGPASTPSDVNE